MCCIYFLILLIYSEDVSISFRSLFFTIFFSVFSICSYVFPNNLVFKICLYANHLYVLFFQIFTFLNLYLVFSKLLKK